MLHIAAILATIGVANVEIGQLNDPETEEEFITSFKCNATWEQYVAARGVYFRERGLRLIRRYRDKLLVESDWIETTYNQNTIANLEEWNAYRQCLRDLPYQIDSLRWVNGRPDFSSLSILPLPQTIRKNTTGSTGPTGTTEEATATGPTGPN